MFSTLLKKLGYVKRSEIFHMIDKHAKLLEEKKACFPHNEIDRAISELDYIADCVQFGEDDNLARRTW